MTDSNATELLKELRDLACDINAAEIIDHIHITHRGWTFNSQWLDSWHNEFDRITDRLEQAVAAMLEAGECENEKLRGQIETLVAYVESDGTKYYVDDEGNQHFDHAATLGAMATCGGEGEECGTTGSLCLSEAEAIEAWNSRAERTCECIMCAYFENKSTCGAYCNYFDRELGDDYDGGCTWGVLSGCKVVGE